MKTVQAMGMTQRAACRQETTRKAVQANITMKMKIGSIISKEAPEKLTKKLRAGRPQREMKWHQAMNRLPRVAVSRSNHESWSLDEQVCSALATEHQPSHNLEVGTAFFFDTHDNDVCTQGSVHPVKKWKEHHNWQGCRHCLYLKDTLFLWVDKGQ